MSKSEQPAADPTEEQGSETDEWVEERREELERIANGDYHSSWVAERMLQTESESEEGDS